MCLPLAHVSAITWGLQEFRNRSNIGLTFSVQAAKVSLTPNLMIDDIFIAIPIGLTLSVQVTKVSLTPRLPNPTMHAYNIGIGPGSETNPNFYAQCVQVLLRYHNNYCCDHAYHSHIGKRVSSASALVGVCFKLAYQGWNSGRTSSVWR